MTFNQEIKLFEDIADVHNDIRAFGNGPLHEYLNKDDSKGVGQTLWVDADGSTIVQGVKTDKFKLYLMDAVNKDISNRNNVLSDTKRSLEDTIAILHNDYYSEFFEIELTSDLSEFYDEKFDNEFCGWSCGIALKTYFDYDSCQANVSRIPTITGTVN
jgi:hypothetical protein